LGVVKSFSNQFLAMKKVQPDEKIHAEHCLNTSFSQTVVKTNSFAQIRDLKLTPFSAAPF